MSHCSPATTQHLERRTVVSILIFPHDPYASRPFRVLLFRRSAKVRTYQNKLAPIAGSVEADDKTPLEAAWRELKEETGLGPQDLELWRRGVGFEFTDEKAVTIPQGSQPKGRIWKVVPFAFRLKKTVLDHERDVNKLGLVLDWEHVGCEWKDIDDIVSGEILHDCVPKLEITVGQLWVDPTSELHHELDRLRQDHEHGARELATMAVRSLVNLIQDDREKLPVDDYSLWERSFRQQAFHLGINGRPSMGAAISSAVATALDDSLDVARDSTPAMFDKLKRRLEAYIVQRGEIPQQVSLQFLIFLQTRFNRVESERNEVRTIKILTLSFSSTIKAAILYALDADASLSIELRILESRPLNEGVRFAQVLTEEAQKRREDGDGGTRFDTRLRIILASDASVAILSKDVDLVVIGADRISEAGDVSNKTGSLATVAVSKIVTNGSVEVICISESDKIATPGAAQAHSEEDNDADELSNSWRTQQSTAWNEMVTIRNVYFEWCPAIYIEHYICEYGTLSKQDIRQKSKEKLELIDSVFPFEEL